MKAKVVDANIILRFLLADHPKHSPRSRHLFEQIQAGKEVVYLPEVALCDVVWTLKSFYSWRPQKISEFVAILVLLDGIQMSRKEIVQDALLFFSEYNFDFSDALIVAEMVASKELEIYSYDQDFDQIKEIRRIEP